MANILITGASGFIGGHLARELTRLGHTVTEAPDPYQDTTFTGPFDILVHQAANTDPQDRNRENMLLANWSGAVEFFRKAIDAGVKRIVYASSAAVYGDGPCPQKEDQQVRPLTAYAESKALLDVSASYLSAWAKIPIIGLRYSNVYGPGEGHKGRNASMVYQLVQQMRTGVYPKLFWHGEQTRDWVSVRDVVKANILAMGCNQSGVYNVGSGTSISFNMVVATINETGRFDLTPEYIKNPFAGSYQDRTKLDLTRSEAVLGYVPEVDLAAGVKELLV